MRKPLQVILAIIILVAAMLVPVRGFAAAPTMSARFFYGTVTINDLPAPLGTVIEARGLNVRTAIQGNPLTTTQSGIYGVAGATGSKLIIQNDPDTGSINPGTQIAFYVNGFLAETAYTWPLESADPVIQLNLAVDIRLSTITSLSSSLNPSYLQQTVVLTATVSSQTPYVTSPGGSVDFVDGLSLLSRVPLSGNQAAYTSSYLSSGAHTITAIYSGDNYYLSSQKSIIQTVNIVSGGGTPPATSSPAPTPTPSPVVTLSPAATTTPPVSVTVSPSATPVTGQAVFDLRPIADTKGQFLRDFEGRSSDGGARINIAAGSLGTTRDGATLTQITIQKVANPGSTPASAAIFMVVGTCYAFEPSGAQFSPAVTLTITYDPAQVPAGQTPYMAWWNPSANQWEKLETVSVDPVNHTVTAKTTHFTIFAVLANRQPVASVTPETTAVPSSPPVMTTTITTTGLPNPPPSQAAETPRNSNSGLIIGLIVGVAILIVVILVLLKRKPKKDASK